MTRPLHIVCSECPSPADNGEAIDIINQLRTFHAGGVNIELHYFESKRKQHSEELNLMCRSVNSYTARKFSECFSLTVPYLVSSKINQQLLDKLNGDDDPVLIHGSACCGIIEHIAKKHRKIAVRLHNEAGCNCRKHANAEAPISQTIFNKVQNELMARYTANLPKEGTYACSSPDCTCSYGMSGIKILHLPLFPSTQKITAAPGTGELCLYHGNLSNPGNEKAVLWLLNHVFNKTRIPFVIAGKNPSMQLQKAAGLYQHVCLITNPTDAELDDLLRKAHINIIAGGGNNGIGTNLKLVHTLFKGRHCVVSREIIDGTGLEQTCYVGTSASDLVELIGRLYHQPFEEKEIIFREKLLLEIFDNKKNIKILEDILW